MATGALGAFYGGRLAQAGGDVVASDMPYDILMAYLDRARHH